MLNYFAVYSGTGKAIGSAFSSGPYDIAGFVEFASDLTENSKLLELAHDIVLNKERGKFGLQLTIDRLVRVSEVIK